MHTYTHMETHEQPLREHTLRTQSHIQIQLQLLLLFRVLTPLWRHVVKAEWSCEENTDAQGKRC